VHLDELRLAGDDADLGEDRHETRTERRELLAGGTCGIMGPGSYFYRPPMVPHGPMYTRSGALFFFRTRGGGLKTDYVAVPGWEQLVEEYRSSAPFFEPPSRRPG
jgi:hypothetical protein